MYSLLKWENKCKTLMQNYLWSKTRHEKVLQYHNEEYPLWWSPAFDWELVKVSPTQWAPELARMLAWGIIGGMFFQADRKTGVSIVHENLISITVFIKSSKLFTWVGVWILACWILNRVSCYIWLDKPEEGVLPCPEVKRPKGV